MPRYEAGPCCAWPGSRAQCVLRMRPFLVLLTMVGILQTIKPFRTLRIASAVGTINLEKPLARVLRNALDVKVALSGVPVCHFFNLGATNNSLVGFAFAIFHIKVTMWHCMWNCFIVLSGQLIVWVLPVGVVAGVVVVDDACQADLRWMLSGLVELFFCHFGTFALRSYIRTTDDSWVFVLKSTCGFHGKLQNIHLSLLWPYKGFHIVKLLQTFVYFGFRVQRGALYDLNGFLSFCSVQWLFFALRIRIDVCNFDDLIGRKPLLSAQMFHQLSLLLSI